MGSLAESHFSYDDIDVSLDDSTIDGYLNVLKQIFFEIGHEAHYQMMMGESAKNNEATEQ